MDLETLKKLSWRPNGFQILATTDGKVVIEADGNTIMTLPHETALEIGEALIEMAVVAKRNAAPTDAQMKSEPASDDAVQQAAPSA